MLQPGVVPGVGAITPGPAAQTISLCRKKLESEEAGLLASRSSEKVIGAAPAYKAVVAGTTDQGIGPRSTRQNRVPRPVSENIASASADGTTASTNINLVVAGPAGSDVVVANPVAGWRRAAVASADQVVAAVTEQLAATDGIDFIVAATAMNAAAATDANRVAGPCPEDRGAIVGADLAFKGTVVAAR